MDVILTDIEVRIFGCLLEKKLATPEYYPLSLNALVNACNQKTNRFPVVSYDETTVINGIEGLVEKKLVSQSDASRVTKYEETFTRDRNLINKETSVLCILLVRGPQTLGEIKARTDRLYKFENIEEVNTTITALVEWGLVIKLPRMKGFKESRFVHLFSELDDNTQGPGTDVQVHDTGHADDIQDEKISVLENKIDMMYQEFQELKQEFSDFKKQFE